MSETVVVITGAAGYIGSALAQCIAARSPHWRLICIERRESHRKNAVGIDLTDYVATYNALKSIRPDVIFHMAGIARGSEWEKLYTGNIETTTNILKAVQAIGSSTKVLIPGSAAEYGTVSATDLPISEQLLPNPVNAYGCVKTIQTTIARYYAAMGIGVVVGRIFNVIGASLPETMAIGAFAAQLAKIKRGNHSPYIYTENLRSKRDFVDIRDICNAFLLLAERGKSGEIYNICSSNSVAMDHILSLLIERSGLDVRVVAKSSAGIGEIDNSVGSNEKIHMETGWCAERSIDDSISDVWRSVAN